MNTDMAELGRRIQVGGGQQHVGDSPRRHSYDLPADAASGYTLFGAMWWEVEGQMKASLMRRLRLCYDSGPMTSTLA